MGIGILGAKASGQNKIEWENGGILLGRMDKLRLNLVKVNRDPLQGSYLACFLSHESKLYKGTRLSRSTLQSLQDHPRYQRCDGPGTSYVGTPFPCPTTARPHHIDYKSHHPALTSRLHRIGTTSVAEVICVHGLDLERLMRNQNRPCLVSTTTTKRAPNIKHSRFSFPLPIIYSSPPQGKISWKLKSC